MNNRGFTLIEVLVSTLLLAIGVLAMVRLFPTASIVNARADRISQATILAEDKIEQIRSMGYDSLKNLISAGADVNAQDKFEITPLLLAYDYDPTGKKYKKIRKMLRLAGAKEIPPYTTP